MGAKRHSKDGKYLSKLGGSALRGGVLDTSTQLPSPSFLSLSFNLNPKLMHILSFLSFFSSPTVTHSSKSFTGFLLALLLLIIITYLPSGCKLSSIRLRPPPPNEFSPVPTCTLTPNWGPMIVQHFKFDLADAYFLLFSCMNAPP